MEPAFGQFLSEKKIVFVFLNFFSLILEPLNLRKKAGLWIFRQPTPVFLPGESQGRGSLVGCRLWGRTESDTTEA